MARQLLTIVFVVLAVSWCACRDASPGAAEFKGLLGVEGKALDLWLPASVQRRNEPETDSRHLQVGGADEMLRIQITLKDGDTLRLFRFWSGMTDAELLAPNQGFGRDDFKEGAVFALVMGQDRFDRFSAKRDLYHQNRAAARDRGETVVRVETHVVAKGETLEAIVARYPTRIDSILRANPELRMRLPYEGQRILVPIIAEVEAARQLAPATVPGPENGESF